MNFKILSMSFSILRSTWKWWRGRKKTPVPPGTVGAIRPLAKFPIGIFMAVVASALLAVMIGVSLFDESETKTVVVGVDDRPTMSDPGAPPKVVGVEEAKQKAEEEVSTFWWFMSGVWAILSIIATLVTIVGALAFLRYVRYKTDWDTLPNDVELWKQTVGDPLGVAAIGLFLFNLLLAFMALGWWWWVVVSFPWMFFFLSACFLLFVGLYTEEGAFKYAAYLVALIAVIGIIYTAKSRWDSRPATKATRATVKKQEGREVVAIPVYNTPEDTALNVIAQCESGGKQFGPDGKTPIVNPKNPGAIGKWQINLNDSAVVRLVREQGWDVATEEGNEAAARYLYRESKLQPWMASRDCWEPKLGKMQTAPNFETVHWAPVGEFGVEIPMRGWAVSWDGGNFEVMDQAGNRAKYENRTGPDLPAGKSLSLRFMSLSDKPARVILTWKRL